MCSFKCFIHIISLNPHTTPYIHKIIPVYKEFKELEAQRVKGLAQGSTANMWQTCAFNFYKMTHKV